MKRSCDPLFDEILRDGMCEVQNCVKFTATRFMPFVYIDTVVREIIMIVKIACTRFAIVGNGTAIRVSENTLMYNKIKVCF